MDLTLFTAKHLLILCCNGGLPFIDLHTESNLREMHKSTHTVDPTDWIAMDTSGLMIILLIRLLMHRLNAFLFI